MTLALEPRTGNSPVPAQRTVATLFGETVVREEHILRFERGLLGFEGYRGWIILEGNAAGTAWLQSTEEAGLAFLLVDPFAAFDGFSVDVPPPVLRALEARESDALAVLALVTFASESGARPTANLRGPVVLNWRTQRGAQCVIDGGDWSVRQTLPPHILN